MTNLKEKSELASRIRENNIQYSREKYLIHSFFEYNYSIVTEKRIMTQLTIIDSYYSTNMSLRYYGIEEIKDSILKISSKQNDLKQKFTEYALNPENHKDITDLFHANYGYNKSGNRSGQAISIITKYAYFTTDFQFPIYDSIVREVYPLIQKGEKLSQNYIDVFVKQMNELLRLTGIENFCKLDDLLWLIGKINRGNYSLILDKHKYLNLVSKITGLENLKSDKIDNRIRDFIKENINDLPDIFTKDQIEMIKFSYTLIKNKYEA